MIDDPAAPGYRYPEPGETYWHKRSRSWVRIAGIDVGYNVRALGEAVAIRETDGMVFVVELAMLEENAPAT